MGLAHERRDAGETRKVTPKPVLTLESSTGVWEAPAARSAAVPPFTCLIHPNSPAPLADIGRVPILPRSALACWWSIYYLRSVASPCYLWTFTAGQVMPHHWFALAHSRFLTKVKNAAVRGTKGSDGGTIPRNWGGVRVIEEHPGGHGLHSHMVLRGRMPWHLLQSLAVESGLGRVVHVDPRPVSEAMGYYLASYLAKNGKIEGIRQWANVGTWDGIGKRDIVIESDRIKEIKAWQTYWRGKGRTRYVAYRLAIECVDDGRSIPGTEPF